MEYILLMSFVTEKGGKCNLNINGVKPDITQAEINTLMDTIITKKVFTTSTGDLIKKSAAHLTEKTVKKFEVAQ